MPTLKEQLAVFEKQILEQTLKDCRFNKSMVAEVLGIDRKTLYNKLAKHKLLPGYKQCHLRCESVLQCACLEKSIQDNDDNLSTRVK